MTKLERLLAKVEQPEGCWVWTGARGNGGYGRIRTGTRENSRVELAHRAMWEAVHGPILGSADVCHTCDNPLCVRPDHLYLGTPATNAQDRTVRGRGRSRLSEVDVRLMRAAHRAGWASITTLAAQFGVAVPTAHNAIRRVTWKHLD